MIKEIPQEFSDCKAIAPELSHLVAWLKANSNISTLELKFAKNMVFHGSAVINDAKDAITQWNSANLYKTGQDMGDALYLLTL